MIALSQFNSLSKDEAAGLLAPCVAIPAWGETLVSLRPFASRHALLQTAREALSAHPRIGEKPTGCQAHAALSRQEQSAVDSENERLAQALREGNARYEARFGRVFLIRAKGRSGEEMLQALTRRLQHTADEEVAEALAQLREITMLRLEGVIGE